MQPNFEDQTGEYISNFCKILEKHTSKWSSLLKESAKPLRALINYCEQLRHVEQANIKYIDNFEELKEKLLFKISEGIEEEIILIKNIINQLNLSNQEIKNKLHILEKSTINLDWEEKSDLLKGTAFQPPLTRILQEGLDFVNYFSDNYKLINEHFKKLDPRNEESIKRFESALQVELKNKIVIDFLALVQYI
ncbi:unnamed protein product [Phyllotreta striolata]|uniref:Uncharacterized protein n=1 Tax=Phyllotreta striolata TaxID=444603 RepID=A0A9N9THH2_PHYSR|nr:unnamed protein product [Phyllotreta striolata]